MVKKIKSRIYYKSVFFIGLYDLFRFALYEFFSYMIYSTLVNIVACLRK